MAAVILRRARAIDCQMYWEWVNDPAVRASAFNTKPISWEHHTHWFAQKLADENCFMWVALDHTGRPLGQVRFDVDADQAGIDVSVAPDWRGKGLGKEIIRRGLEAMNSPGQIRAFHAFVKQNNMPSLQTFRHTGFQEVGLESTEMVPTVHLIWRADA